MQLFRQHQGLDKTDVHCAKEAVYIVYAIVACAEQKSSGDGLFIHECMLLTVCMPGCGCALNQGRGLILLQYNFTFVLLTG